MNVELSSEKREVNRMTSNKFEDWLVPALQIALFPVWIVGGLIQLAYYKYKNDKNPEGSHYNMVNKIIKHFNKETGIKMERNKSKNKVESLFAKIEELKNIESRLINERIIRIERINFEIEETKKEIVKAEEELKLKLNELSYDLEPGIKSNAKDLSFEMKGVEKIK